jgi:glycosyltransferase involved in cell wall biosynthesis
VGEGRRRGFPVVLRPEGAGATGDIAWQAWGRFGKKIAARCKQADAYVSISQAVTEELTTAGYDATKIHALPNGVPVPEPAWNRRPNWREAPRAAFLGRLAPEKGLDLLIDAWPTVRETFPNARLTIVGEGPERPALEARVERLGLIGAVELPGTSDDSTAVLRTSDLFVLPSREEGMSIALLEAMALGVPLVATSIPGNRRVIQTFKHGRLVAPEDSAALARGILDQWNTFDRAFQMSREARRRIQNEFSIGAVAKRHIELFMGLIRRS